jgi:hypothetical protein
MTAPETPFPFSRNYAEARMRFLDACAEAIVGVRTYEHPERGPEGEQLALDAAWFGSTDADRVLVTISATHGVEGFCGAGIQVDWVDRFGSRPMPEGLAVLHLHALNPHGFAWIRRVNEDNVDLNRNFVDFARPLPENPGYEALADALMPESLEPAVLEKAEAAIGAYRAEHGQQALELAVTGGQYTHPDGLFYGGVKPTWSRRTIEAIMHDYDLYRRSAVAVVDLHTGLGPFGYGEVICDHPPDSPATVRGRRWYGESMTEPALGTSTSVAKAGLLDYCWQQALGKSVTFVTLEYGTYPLDLLFRYLRADHILHRGGLPDWNAPETQALKKALRHHFFPDTPEWREMILTRGREVLRQARDGLLSE